jgi:trehalose/maltose hydrolase-like predicted phosphorylase
MNMELDVDGRRVGPGNISNFRQELNMQTAELVTTFEVGNKISVRHTLMSLRHLPFTAMTQVADYGQKSRGNQPHLGNRGP